MTTSVDIQGMQLAQQDFQQALDQMNSVYSAMTEEQDTLTANWSGMAASAFGQALTAWLDDLYQIRQELVVMTESLSVHTGVYGDANETSQQVVAAFQHGLEGLAGLSPEPLVAERTVHKLLPQGIHARVRANQLPEHMVALERVRGTLLPEHTVAEKRMLVNELPEHTVTGERMEGTLLPELPEAPLARVEPAVPGLFVKSVHVPAGVATDGTQPELLDRFMAPSPLLPMSPVEPLQPTLLELPELPNLPESS